MAQQEEGGQGVSQQEVQPGQQQQGPRLWQGWRAGPAPCPSLGLLSQGTQGQALQEEGAPAPTVCHDPH